MGFGIQRDGEMEQQGGGEVDEGRYEVICRILGSWSWETDSKERKGKE